MPAAAIAPRDKYFLRSLHQEIGLFDRKLAHLLNHETFTTEALRTAAANKLITKRNQLTITARQLAADGVEFKPSELPPSLRPDDFVMPEPEPQAAPAELPTIEQHAPAARENNGYDFGQEIRDYLAQRKKK
jgi:hypothetical protein